MDQGMVWHFRILNSCLTDAQHVDTSLSTMKDQRNCEKRREGSISTHFGPLKPQSFTEAGISSITPICVSAFSDFKRQPSITYKDVRPTQPQNDIRMAL